jgi:hypothetical protein
VRGIGSDGGGGVETGKWSNLRVSCTDNAPGGGVAPGGCSAAMTAPLRRGIERRRRGRAAGGYKLVDKSNHRVFAILARDAARSSRWCGPLLESVTEWQ